MTGNHATGARRFGAGRTGAWIAVVAGLAMSAAIVPGCRPDEGDPAAKKAVVTGDKKKDDIVRIAFITNNVNDFWSIAEAGCRAAEKELGNVKVEVVMPQPPDVKTQKDKLESVLNSGVQAVAISPINAAALNDVINTAAGKLPLICHDNDAKGTKRLVYIGTDNVSAGMKCGEAFLEVSPAGGAVCVFVGEKGSQNGQERLEGFKKATAGKVEVLEVFEDHNDQATCKRQIEGAIRTYGDKLKGLVGLWAYNSSAIVNVLSENSEAAARIKGVGFDEEQTALDGIRKGLLHATVVQNPYEFGYRSVKLLNQLVRGDKSGLPAGWKEDGTGNSIVDVPVRVIKKDNVDAFEADLKKLRSGGGTAK